MAERKAYLQEMHTRALALMPHDVMTGVNWADPNDAIILSVDQLWAWLDAHVAHERTLVMRHPAQDVTKLLAKGVELMETAMGVMGGEADNPDEAAWFTDAEQFVGNAKEVIP